jgi:hypothetical protein
MQNRKSKLLKLIDAKLAEAQSSKSKRTKPTPSTRAQVNRANGLHSTGPKTAEGKAKVSANALKAGFFASTERLNPQDSPAYQDAVEDLRMGLHPDGPVEEQLIRELAMFRARLLRLEAAEYATLCADIETDPTDAREIATAYLNNGEALDQLHKIELHLRRAYNRTWDRLERMQKERKKMPLDQALKQTQIHATYEAIRTTCPKCNAGYPDAWKEKLSPRHPAIDEKGKLIKYPNDHPMYRPKDEED